MPESTSSNIAPGSIPALQTLPIPPYGVEIFTDIERGKVFTRLCFKHFGGERAAVLAWIEGVLDTLAAADIPVSGPCDITLTPDIARSTTARVKYRCHLKVPVELKE